MKGGKLLVIFTSCNIYKIFNSLPFPQKICKSAAFEYQDFENFWQLFQDLNVGLLNYAWSICTIWLLEELPEQKRLFYFSKFNRWTINIEDTVLLNFWKIYMVCIDCRSQKFTFFFLPRKDWKSYSTPVTAANKVAQEVFCLNLLQMLQLLQIWPYLRPMIYEYGNF